MNIFHSSALLGYLQDEPGADIVKRELLIGGACSTANWAETAQKTVAHEHDWSAARQLLLSYGLVVEPVLIADAERAAALWMEHKSLSLADRICLATAERLAHRCGRLTRPGELARRPSDPLRASWSANRSGVRAWPRAGRSTDRPIRGPIRLAAC